MDAVVANAFGHSISAIYSQHIFIVTLALLLKNRSYSRDILKVLLLPLKWRGGLH